MRTVFIPEAHQQVLNQSFDVLGSLRGRRIVRRELDKRGQEILTLLDILLHFLWMNSKQLLTLCVRSKNTQTVQLSLRCLRIKYLLRY